MGLLARLAMGLLGAQGSVLPTSCWNLLASSLPPAWGAARPGCYSAGEVPLLRGYSGWHLGGCGACSVAFNVRSRGSTLGGRGRGGEPGRPRSPSMLSAEGGARAALPMVVIIVNPLFLRRRSRLDQLQVEYGGGVGRRIVIIIITS